MSKNDKTGTEEDNFSLRCVQDDQKDGGKNSEAFQETPLSAAIVQKRLVKSAYLLDGLKYDLTRIVIFT